MRHAILCATVIFAASASTPAGAEPAQKPLEVRVLPLYDFIGPKVQVGAFSEGLASKDKRRFLSTVTAMKGRFDELSAESMYVAAIRLYDFGMRDAAVYWFYAGQYRAMLLEGLAVPRSATKEIAANKSFREIAGRIINGYAFCDRQELTDTLSFVAEQHSVMPDLRRIYPNARFVPSRLWAPTNLRIAQGFQDLSQEINDRWDEIQSKRDANGMNVRFCRR